MARALTFQPTAKAGLPSLKAGKGEWAHTAIQKTKLLADTARKKFSLPPWQGDVIFDVPVDRSAWSGYLRVRQRVVKQILKDADENTATAQDGIPNRVLRRCRLALAPLLTGLVYHCFVLSEWPWRLHWLAPVYKRGLPVLPTNYRMVHLTSNISKVAERAYKHFIQGRCESLGLLGHRQWAYRKHMSSCDLLAFLLTTWIATLAEKGHVGLYLGTLRVLLIRLTDASCS